MGIVAYLIVEIGFVTVVLIYIPTEDGWEWAKFKFKSDRILSYQYYVYTEYLTVSSEALRTLIKLMENSNNSLKMAP